MRSRVWVSRHRFQRTRDPSDRLRREVYYKAEYAKYKLMIKQAKQNKFLESVIQKNKLDEDGKDPSKCGSYRPIYLLSVWAKILDKLMSNRLKYYLETNYVLNEAHFGFRKGRSTITAPARIKDFVVGAKEENKISCMVSFDIQNAFNSIKWTDIKKQLVAYKVPRKLERLLDSFLSDGSTWKYNIGVPQGSCAGPVLWLLIINEVLNQDNNNENVYLQAYADDIALLMKTTASYHFKEMSREIIVKLG
ncbi:hypothetical protein AVEN_92244-1 [Araneus ventricosus]|uniref:Reverse transcriptase domain-containing protein n=1 Tax=Araneus ventricosus TaxID=182803 RepID=A0A4Y2AM57_ARAVE|nr:hypothetical protein AVEN_92244-1 [Araneus ventricosus]